MLVEEGLAVFRDNPDDRRADLLALMSRGEKVLEEIYALDRAWSRKLMKRLDPEKLSALAAALDEVARIIRTELDKETEGAESGRKGRS